MYALIYKDFLLLKKQLLYVLVLAVFYTVIAVSGFLSASILPGMVVLFATMLPITSFSYDEQARWGQYAAATPAGRRLRRSKSAGHFFPIHIPGRSLHSGTGRSASGC